MDGSSSPDEDKEEEWKGYYEQAGTQHDMAFDHFKINGKKIRGRGSDGVGHFLIRGKIDDKDAEFTK